MRKEFQVHHLNEAGLTKAEEASDIFSDALEELEKLVPAGRERALVVTKMQEACFFAKRAIALDPVNCEEPAMSVVDDKYSDWGGKH